MNPCLNPLETGKLSEVSCFTSWQSSRDWESCQKCPVLLPDNEPLSESSRDWESCQKCPVLLPDNPLETGKAVRSVLFYFLTMNPCLNPLETGKLSEVSCFTSSLQSSLTSHEHSVVWRRLWQGWVRSGGGAHRYLATARANLKASGELAWTVLLLSLFQAIIVHGKKDFILFNVTAWDWKAAVVVAGLFIDQVLDNVVRAVGRTDISASFLGGQIFIRRAWWNQPLDHLVEEGQPQVFTPFLQSREVMLPPPRHMTMHMHLSRGTTTETHDNAHAPITSI